MLENSGMASGGRGKFSVDFKAQSKETSAEKHPPQKGFSLTLANQEDKTSVSEISDPPKVTEEPQAQILKPDLEIPHQALLWAIEQTVDNTWPTNAYFLSGGSLKIGFAFC